MADTFTLPPVQTPGPGALPDPVGSSVSTGEVVSRLYQSSTGVGSLVKRTFAPSIQEGFDRSFNSWDYISTLGDEDKEIAFQFADRMGLLVSPEAVDNRIASVKDELRTSTVLSKATGGQVALGIGASFFDASTLIPVAGVLGKVGTASNAVLRYAAVGGGLAAVDEALIASTQETYDPKQAFLNIGAGTLLGGGLGAFARLYNSPARAKRSVEAFTETPEHQIIPPEGKSAGAAYDPNAWEAQVASGLNDAFDVKPVWTDSVFGGLSRIVGNGVLSPATFARKISKISPTMNKLLQNLVDIEGAADGTVRGMTAQSGKFLMDNRMRATFGNFRQSFERMSAELGGSKHQYGPLGIAARIKGQPPVSKEAFNQIVAKKLRDKSYRYTDSDVVDKYAGQAAEPMREHLFDLFRRSSDQGLQRTNKLAKMEKKVQDLERKMVEKERLTRETPTGRKRKDGTKAAEEARLKYERAKARYGRAAKQVDDFTNYLPQVWMKRVIRSGSKEDFVKILAGNFMRRASDAKNPRFDDDMVLSSLRSRGVNADEGYVDEVMDAYEQGGFKAVQELDKDLADDLVAELEAHARFSAERVFQDMRKTNGRMDEVGEIDPEFSARFEGRRIDLDDQAFDEMTEAGYLVGDVEVLLHQYTRDVGSKVVMKERFGTLDLVDDMDNPMVVKMKDELDNAGLKPGEVDAALTYLKTMNERMLGFSDHTGTELGRYFTRNVTRYAGTMLTGTAGITALGDLTGQVLTQGIGGFVTNSFRSTMVKAHAKLGSEEAKAALIGHDMYLGAIRARALIGDEPIQRMQMQRGVGVGLGRQISGSADKVNEVAYSTLQYLNGQQFLTHFYRAQGGSWLLNKMASGTFDQKTLDHLKNLGLDEAKLTKLKNGPKFNAGEHRGMNYEMIDIAEIAKTDRALADVVEIALDRNARIMSVQIGEGTLPPMFDHNFAKVIFQFGQYMSAMTDNIFRNKLKYGILPNDFAQVGQIGFLLGVGISIDMLKSLSRGQVPDVEGKFSTPERVAGTIYDSMDRIGFLGLLSPYSKFFTQFGANTLDLDLFGGSGRYRDVELTGLLLGPTSAIVDRTQSMLSGIQAGEGDAAFYHGLRLLPFNTVAGIRSIVDQARPE